MTRSSSSAGFIFAVAGGNLGRSFLITVIYGRVHGSVFFD